MMTTITWTKYVTANWKKQQHGKLFLMKIEDDNSSKLSMSNHIPITVIVITGLRLF